MNDRELLNARVVSALVDLDKAADALLTYEPKKAAISATWGTLQNALEAHRTRIDELLEGLAASPLEVSWSDFTTLQADLRSTTKEILALLQGGALRDAEKDGGVYALADALVREVADAIGKPWAGMTLPGEGEFVDTRSSLIRLTFPQVSIWDLPIALHEYGHQVAPELQNEVGRPFDLLRKAARSAVARAHITELFADAFAAYTCGPAFACTLILLRFDPTAEETTRDLPTHPSHDRRVTLVLRVLREWEGRNEDARWTSLIGELSDAWRSTREVSRPPWEADEETEAASERDGTCTNEPTMDISDLFPRLHGILNLVPKARYKSWGRARTLARRLRPEDGKDRDGSSLDEDLSIRDVLNAAWLARLKFPADWSSIGSRAESLIRKVAE